MAGIDYDTPWTRDTAINTVNAVAIMNPDIAKNTMLSVLEKEDSAGNGTATADQDASGSRRKSYGRHSGTVWPHAQGFWALAMRKADCGNYLQGRNPFRRPVPPRRH